jgi:uncharacterized membrane protein
MNFTISVDIDQPIEKVVELWQDEKNLSKWQDGYLGSEMIFGHPGEVGTRTKMKYLMGKRKIDLVEIILENKLPKEFLAKYESKTTVNTMHNVFESLSENKTRWTATIHYSSFTGFLVKAMAFLLPGMFKKQSQKWLDQFKVFVENS